MIKLLTGNPGSGKTLHLVYLIVEALKTGRPVYVCGVNGLDPSLGDWHELENPNDWRDLPDGSFVFVDEVQERDRWPQRRSGEVSEAVRDLSKHRHRGFDFVITTQFPTMVDTYVRKLVGEHVHVLRQFGMQASKLVTWSECFDDPQSQATRDRGTAKLWLYPKELFNRYKSATLHTVKPRIPLRMKLIPVIALAVIGLGIYGWASVASLAETDLTEDAHAIAGKGPIPASGALGGGAQPNVPKYADAAAYAIAHTPRIASQPWTAPVFDTGQPLAKPELYCVAMETGRCICHTEQGTRYRIELNVCHDIVANGVYNPYRLPVVPPPAQVVASSNSTPAPGRKPDTLPGITVRDTPKDPAQSFPALAR